MKYRKKPVVIEAEQYNGDPSDARLFCQEAFAHNGKLIIPTLEGDHVCNKGDYIIRGVKGEYYPCKADIFAMTYEPVAEDGENETTVAYFTLCKDNELGDVYKCASCGNEMYGNMPKYCSECGKRIVEGDAE